MSGSRKIRTKRVYQEPSDSDGRRILIDRLWPRGLTKEKAAIDLWLKEVSPSKELREWFGHDPEKWAEFKRRYFAELDGNEEAVVQLRAELKKGKATIVYGAKDEEHSNARALLEYLDR